MNRSHLAPLVLFLLACLSASLLVGCYVHHVEHANVEPPPPRDEEGVEEPEGEEPEGEEPEAGDEEDTPPDGPTECASSADCPDGAACVQVQCVRAPCPALCQTTGGAATESGGGVGDSCGSRGLPPCGEGLDCIHPIAAACGETDRPGACQERPRFCTRDYRPVCGCDGRTYSNACGALSAGVSVRSEGPCSTQDATR